MPAASGRPHRLLFVKQQLAYPRASGHDIRCFEMLRAFRNLGHDVALATVEPCDDATRIELGVPLYSLLSEGNQRDPAPSLQYWQERFRSYWGIPRATISAVSRVAAQFNADTVIGLGLDVLPMLAGAGDRRKVWYAGDEWVTHHLSLFKPLDTDTYGELRAAIVKGLYQRAFAGSLARAWVVSSKEQRAMRRWGGVAHVDAIANGVDTDFFTPQGGELIDSSAIFWGRLDFGPNIQAIDWLCDRVWPQVLARVPSARLTIMGFNAGPAVMARAAASGVEIRTDVPDIRPYVGRHQIALLPMVSGGGIKNKLLEAAALGKAIVCTSMACSGLRGTPPAVIVDDEGGWVDAIVRLWTSPGERQQFERSARAWILDHHTWEAAAREALRGLDMANDEHAIRQTSRS
jgi:glycosyltransferase involved in cell wall biosynthesis